jgi:putative ABC transport system permease protein
MILFRKVIRTIGEHKGRYVGSALLVLIGSLMFIVMLGTAGNLDRTFTTFAETNAMSDVEFATDTTADTASLAQRFDADIEAGGTADIEVSPGGTLRVFALMDLVNRPAVTEGHAPGPGEILLDELWATTNGYPLGSTVTLGSDQFAVAGYVLLPNYIYVVRSKEELIRDPATFGIAVVGRDDFATLPGTTGVYALRFHDRDNIQAQLTDLRAGLRADGATLPSWQVTERKTNVSYVVVETQTLSTMSRAVPVAILGLVGVLLGMLTWRTVRAEAPLLGTLAAFGYRKSALRRHYLLFPLLVVGVGSVFGVAAGAAAVGPMMAFMLTALPMPSIGVTLNGWAVLGALLVPVLVLGALTWLVVGRVLKDSPAALMKGEASDRGPNALERALRLGRLPFTWKFRIREQVRSLTRSAFLVLGVVAATMLTLYGLTMQSSVNYLLNQGVRELYNLEYEYVFTQPRTEPPPAGTEPFGAALVSAASDEDTTFYITGILPDTTRMRLRDADSGQPLTGPGLRFDQATITAPLAQTLGVGVGDQLAVIDTDTGQEHTVTIEALADTYAGDFVFWPLDRFNTEFNLPAGTYAGVWSDTELSFPPGQVASTKSIDSIVDAFRALLDQMGPLIYGLVGGALVVGLIVMYIVTGLVVDENRRTISLLKVFGYRPRLINRLTLNANTGLVVLGYLLGIPALIGSVGAHYPSLTSSLQLVIPVKLNPWYMLLGFLVILAAYELAKLACRRKVTRIPMSDSIKPTSE